MKSLAVKYRPNTFDSICGQQSILKILKRQTEVNKIKNCYLFCGPSGTGKTTIARALANIINKNKGTPIEIDAASNNGVDNIRGIIEEAQLRAIDCDYKIFIIDECHSITSQGWQAFLKTLEEPPVHTIFMFCTTNPEKIPVTILNRVMRFSLSKVSTEEIFNRLCFICQNEGFTNYEETCDYISKIANGGVRDAIVLLEKVADYSNDLNIENTLQVLGSYSYKDFLHLTNALVDVNEKEVLSVLDSTDSQGKDLKGFVDQFMSFSLDMIKYVLFKDMHLTKLPLSLEEDVKYAVSFEKNIDVFNLIVDKMLKLKNTIRYDDNSVLTIRGTFIELLEDIKLIWENR